MLVLVLINRERVVRETKRRTNSVLYSRSVSKCCPPVSAFTLFTQRGRELNRESMLRDKTATSTSGRTSTLIFYINGSFGVWSNASISRLFYGTDGIFRSHSLAELAYSRAFVFPRVFNSLELIKYYICSLASGSEREFVSSGARALKFNELSLARGQSISPLDFFLTCHRSPAKRRKLSVVIKSPANSHNNEGRLSFARPAWRI